MKIKGYRPDIDGLRAIAVVAVILFHSGFTTFSGGYVGVDVFFVISGYLITRLLMKDINLGRFSIASFYERRIRRIFPAYIGLAVGVILIGYWLFPDDDFLALTESVFASTLSWANIFFFLQAGYWDTASETKPMLHTWSLSVEEQFYVVYPIILFLISRYARKYLFSGLVTISLITFVWSLYVVDKDPTAAFYLTHLRAWELIIGGIIAVHYIPMNKFLRDGTASLGLILILISIFLYSKDTLFPGLSASLPVLGSALIIHAGISGENIISRILALSPFTFVGKISYSLYLWHWPIIVFGNYYLIRRATTIDLIIMITIALVLAVFSWAIIERPFRNKTFLSRRMIFAVAGLVSAILVSFNFINRYYDGFPLRFADYYAAIGPDWNNEHKKWVACRASKRINSDGSVKLCTLGTEKNAKPQFMVWGDSHAMAFAAGVNESARRTGTLGVISNLGGCFPSMHYVTPIKNMVRNCTKANQHAIQYLRKHKDIQIVFLIARWNFYLTGALRKGEVIEAEPITMWNSPESATTNAQVFYLLLKDTISRIRKMGKEVVLVLDVPEVGYNVPDGEFIAFRTDQDLNRIIAPTHNQYANYNRPVTDIFLRLENEFDNVKILDPTTLICPDNDLCLVTMNHTPIYMDDDHLSTFGAKFLAGLFAESLNGLRK